MLSIDTLQHHIEGIYSCLQVLFYGIAHIAGAQVLLKYKRDLLKIFIAS